MNRRIFSVLLLCTMLTGCAGEVEPETTLPEATVLTEPETTQPEMETTLPEPEEKRFTLTFVGDCTLGNSQEGVYSPYSFVNVVGENYRYPFENVIGYFENDDFTMLNLEVVLGDRGSPADKTHVFRGPAAYTAILTENSVEAVTVANNHTMDYGILGYQTTVAALEEAGVPFAENAGTALVTTDSGLTVGIYAASFSVDKQDMADSFAALREQGAEVIVFAIHWGVEYSYTPYAELAQMGRDIIDAGADIVYGCHPHVLQPIEDYNDGVILYSMGNFSFGGNTDPRDYDSAIVQQEIIRDSEGAITLGERTIVPVSVSSSEGINDYRPTPYEPGSEGYDRVMAKLSGSWGK